MKPFLFICPAIVGCSVLLVSSASGWELTEDDPIRLPSRAAPLNPPVPLATEVARTHAGARGEERPGEPVAASSATPSGQRKTTSFLDTALPPGLLPPDPAAEFFAGDSVYVPRNDSPQAPLRFAYANPALGFCHRPLYFEQVRLERYGVAGRCPTLLSAAHFFGTIPILPYKMTVTKPRETVCTFGRRCRFATSYPWNSRRRLAVTTQAAVVAGLIFALP